MSPEHTKKLGEIAELNDIIEQTYYFQQKMFELNQKLEANKEKISKAMGRRERIAARVDEHTVFTAKKSTNMEIEFFPEQLQQNLSKNAYKKVIDKEVTVKNLEGLIKFLKYYGVPAKEFKNFIKVKHIPDSEKIDSLIEIGEITLDQIQGCYRADYREDIKVTKTK